MKPTSHCRSAASTVVLMLLLLGAAACGPSQPPPLEQAATEATDDLLSQTQKLPAFLARVEKTLSKPSTEPRRGVVIDPMLDTTTGQQTAATTLLEQRVTERMKAKFDRFEFLPFQASNLTRAQYLLTGTMTRVPSQPSKRVLRIDLALTELRSGNVIAQASALARDQDIDNTPLRYYKDSPVLLKDKVIEGYTRTAATPAGQKADAYYLERIAAATLIHEATTLYNAERYQEALGQYRNVLSTPEGEQLRTLSGIYVTSVKLGKTADAEKAFAKVVALGFAYDELGVKFLFNPGSTEFWSDPKISGAYGMWLRQIAREAVSSKSCMAILGHTSHSGPAPINDALSLKRAAYVRQRLAQEAPELAARTRAEGMGFRQNIVGSGTDNAVDALDRRVEFRIVPCT